LKDGDVVEMDIDALGTLTNNIVMEETDWSILKLKKG
jgi:fumarylacetoacetate (FAA) hydrolase